MRIRRLDGAAPRYALADPEAVGGEPERERSGGMVPDPRGEAARVEGVVDAALGAVVGGVLRRALIVREGEVAAAAEVLAEGEVVPGSLAGAAREVDLACLEGAVGRARRG